jgi:hypothetical protein
VTYTETTAGKSRRLASAVGFLAGILACLNAVRDAKVLWPPEALWMALPHPQRLELGAGIALVVASVIINAIR